MPAVTSLAPPRDGAPSPLLGRLPSLPLRPGSQKKWATISPRHCCPICPAPVCEQNLKKRKLGRYLFELALKPTSTKVGPPKQIHGSRTCNARPVAYSVQRILNEGGYILKRASSSDQFGHFNNGHAINSKHRDPDNRTSEGLEGYARDPTAHKSKKGSPQCLARGIEDEAFRENGMSK